MRLVLAIWLINIRIVSSREVPRPALTFLACLNSPGSTLQRKSTVMLQLCHDNILSQAEIVSPITTLNGVEKRVPLAHSWVMNRLIPALALLAALCAACNHQGGASPPPAEPREPTQAQPALQTIKLWLGAEEMTAEMALTDRQRQTGMMFRTNLAENAGMLFVFPVPHRASFWMANTLVPLSAAYLSPEGVILEIHALEPRRTNAVVAASDRVQFALETNQGWFERHNLGVGAIIRTERGTLRDTFFRRR